MVFIVFKALVTKDTDQFSESDKNETGREQFACLHKYSKL